MRELLFLLLVLACPLAMFFMMRGGHGHGGHSRATSTGGSQRVLWLEDGRLKALAALVRDPVCGMLLDPTQAPATLEQAGATLHFCSLGCRDQYEREQAEHAGFATVDNTPMGYGRSRQPEEAR
jgi:YHS domain-containing protein